MKMKYVDYIKNFLPQGKYASFTLLLFIIILELLTNYMADAGAYSIKDSIILSICYVIYVIYVIYNLNINFADRKSKKYVFIFLYLLFLFLITFRMWFKDVHIDFLFYTQFLLFVLGCIGSFVCVVKQLVMKVKQEKTDYIISNEAMYYFGLCLVILFID